MKLTIILLLFVCVGRAQDLSQYAATSTDSSDGLRTQDLKYYKIDTSPQYQERVIVFQQADGTIVVKVRPCDHEADLSRFLEECWNDSTLVTQYEYMVACADTLTCPRFNLYEEHWHRKIGSQTYTHRLENASAMELLRAFTKWMEKR